MLTFILWYEQQLVLMSFNVNTSYHLLLGMPWLHNFHIVPSIYHQCLKVTWRGKKVHVNVSKTPFEKNKARFFEDARFDALAEDEEVMPACPQGIKVGEGLQKTIKNFSGKAILHSPQEGKA